MIKVGKAIYGILANNEQLRVQINNKIFPLVATEKTTFPFIVYKRVQTKDNPDTKDRLLCNFISSITISIVSDKYEDGLNIADNVINSLVNFKGEIAGFDIKRIVIDNSDEEYSDDAYVQNITFNIKYN